MTDSSRVLGDVSECGRTFGSLRACPLAADLEAFLLAVNGLRADLAAHRSACPAAEVTKNEMRRAENQAAELQAAIGHTLAALRGRMRAAPTVDY